MTAAWCVKYFKTSHTYYHFWTLKMSNFNMINVLTVFVPGQADWPSQEWDFIVFQCTWNQGSLGSLSKQLEQAQQNNPNMIISSWRDHKENT